MKKRQLSVGDTVHFDSEDGIQTGTIAGFKTDVGNGESTAVIQVPGTQGNTPWNMPVRDLVLSKAAA